jgi:hypothetical protein
MVRQHQEAEVLQRPQEGFREVAALGLVAGEVGLQAEFGNAVGHGRECSAHPYEATDQVASSASTSARVGSDG